MTSEPTQLRRPPAPAEVSGGSADVLLRTHALTKHFGPIVAVDHLDMEVHAGEVHGFLGPNGSGKSTTVGMVMDLIRPSAGSVELFGRRLAEAGHALLASVGAIVENPAFYPYLSGRDNLRAIALAAGGVPERRIDELLELVGLTERARSRFATYSLGMKQRLGIASTLLTDPRLVILDEPTNGLDPAGQREIRELIPRLASEGRGVLLASHLLHEVEQVCDRVTIIRRGRLVQSGRVRELLQRGGYLEIGVEEPGAAAEVLRSLPFVEGVRVDDGAIAVTVDPARARDLTRALAQAGHYPDRVIPHTSTLEEVFLELTERDSEPEAAS
jgi:ABC-2 type transport system ATP-binding protein